MPDRHRNETKANRLSKRKPRRVFGLGLLYFPSDPPPAIFVVVAEDLEGAYLRGILHVSANAGASIIITHTHNPERFRRILRQFAKVNDIGSLLHSWTAGTRTSSPSSRSEYAPPYASADTPPCYVRSESVLP